MDPKTGDKRAGGSAAAQKRLKKKRKRNAISSVHLPVTARASSSAAASGGTNPHIVEAGDVGASAGSPPLAANGKASIPRSPAAALAWMLAPVSLERFFDEYWEKKPLVVRRQDRHYYDSVLTSTDIMTMLREHYLKFTVNVDVTKYEGGQRTTLNPEGRATPCAVSDFYQDGCSVRILNPQSYHDPLWNLVYSLQEYFGSMVGANSYLTPAGTQGFAPHFDDIEAFILQTEGSKRWRMYHNPSGQKLPTYSSPNFSADEIGECFLDVTLHPGDLMYFPRGVVHQGVAQPDNHSLHVTVSSYQNNSWGHYMQKLVPRALQLAMEESDEWRSGLPVNYLSYMGLVHSESTDDRREEFLAQAKALMAQLVEYAPFDAAADQMGIDFLHSCMPPALSKRAHSQSAMSENIGFNHAMIRWSDKTKIKLISPHVARLVGEQDCVVLYYTAENSKIPHGEEPQSLEFPEDVGPALEHVLVHANDFIAVSELPQADSTDSVLLAKTLFDAGVILATNK